MIQVRISDFYGCGQSFFFYDIVLQLDVRLF